MRNIFKCLAVVAIITVIFLCASALAETSGTDGNTSWTLSDDGVLTIRGTGAMSDYTSSRTAPWGTSATSVVIESGITSVGSYAFYGCSDITSIAIPDTVTVIRNSAFENCRSLSTVTIPGSVTTFGELAFGSCSSLQKSQSRTA